MSVPRDREVRERERLSRVWAALGEEQDSMKRQGESLNNLTKQLENLRTRLDAEDANFGPFTEALLVQVLDVEQNIKKGLDFMEKVLGKEKKRFHKEVERVKMEGIWNVVEGHVRRNTTLAAIEVMWVEEERKIDGDMDKVEELRQMCWQRMGQDARRLERMRAAEQARKKSQRQQEREQQHRARREKERADRERGYATDAGKPHRTSRRTNSYDPRTEKQAYQDAKTVEAFATFQARLAVAMHPSSTTPITFVDIPWPINTTPSGPHSLTPNDISNFLLSPAHCSKPMDRLRDALTRFHPDKCERLMARVPDYEKSAVAEGLAMVTRSVIELIQIQRKLS